MSKPENAGGPGGRLYWVTGDAAGALLNPSRWAASETQAAYRLLEKLLTRLNPETDAASSVYQAMEAVERADCDLGSRA